MGGRGGVGRCGDVSGGSGGVRMEWGGGSRGCDFSTSVTNYPPAYTARPAEGLYLFIVVVGRLGA